MLTKEEKKAALNSISFNRGKAFRLFVFCLASFCVGICVWYWQQNQAYGDTLDYYKHKLLGTMNEQIKDHNFSPLSQLHDGVVACEGVVDFDQVVYLNSKPNLYEKRQHAIKVKGQKRQIALGIYELRFVPVKSAKSS